jgi:hypothetical protein
MRAAIADIRALVAVGRDDSVDQRDGMTADDEL